jgi:carbon monoxide dehydrogenase subunit G
MGCPAGATGHAGPGVTHLQGVFELPASREAAWDVLADVRVLASCIPEGVEVEVEVADERHATLAARVRAGFLSVTLRGSAELVDLVRPDSLGIRGSAGALGTSVSLVAEARLAGDGATTVHWTAEIDLAGPLAASAASMVERGAPSAVDRLADCLRRRLASAPGALGTAGAPGETAREEEGS